MSKEGGDWMRRAGYIAMHALVAGAFFFVVQRYPLEQSVQSSIQWAAFFAVAAAIVAWRQTQ
jgi:hypothetical protein